MFGLPWAGGVKLDPFGRRGEVNYQGGVVDEPSGGGEGEGG